MLKWLLNWFKTEEIEPDPMKYLIVGLGNMGAKYDDTRHNIGFEVVDYLADKKSAEWKSEHLGDVARIKHRGRTYVLLKPSTFMNLSGKAVRYWLQKEKINKENLLVIMDDLNLEFGQVRLRGHRGQHQLSLLTLREQRTARGIDDLGVEVVLPYRRGPLGLSELL